MAQEPMKLRWLIAHQPAHLFIRTAEAFAAELEKELPGKFEIEIMNMAQYIERYGDIPELSYQPGRLENIESPLKNNNKWVSVEWADIKNKWNAFFQGLRDTKIHLSQTQITVIGGYLDRRMATLDLPFLFKNHDHVTATLDGKIGDELCERLASKTNVRGLAFTYSGGYRIVGSNHPINSLEELKQVPITTVPLTEKFFDHFSSKSTSRLNQKLDDTAEQVAQGGAIETTYLRFDGKNILKTNHSMFLTSILVGGPFFDSLSSEYQEVFKKAAKAVAKLERQWSLEDAETYETNALEKGIKIVEVSEAETEKMKKTIPDHYNKVFEEIEGSKDLVYKIKSTAI